MRDASKLSLTRPCGLGSSSEESCSTIVNTIDELDGGSRLGRYLFGKHSMVFRYEQPRMPNNIRVSVDSEVAASRAALESTTGMVHKLGRHPIKTTSDLQTSVGLNVSECEFCALANGAAHGLGLQPCIKLHRIIESDSSSAKACASRGLGKQHHSQKPSLVDPRIGCSKQLGDQESTDTEQHR